jgi:hypothetical protein
VAPVEPSQLQLLRLSRQVHLALGLQMEDWLDNFYCITPFSTCTNDTTDYLLLDNAMPPPPPPLTEPGPGCMPVTNSSTRLCLEDWGA